MNRWILFVSFMVNLSVLTTLSALENTSQMLEAIANWITTACVLAGVVLRYSGHQPPAQTNKTDLTLDVVSGLLCLLYIVLVSRMSLALLYTQQNFNTLALLALVSLSCVLLWFWFSIVGKVHQMRR